MEESGHNRTDKLSPHERGFFWRVMKTTATREMVSTKIIIGVGKFAEGGALAALGKTNRAIGTILHPSPASPAANRGWQAQVEKQLHQQGIKIPRTNNKGREL